MSREQERAGGGAAVAQQAVNTDRSNPARKQRQPLTHRSNAITCGPAAPCPCLATSRVERKPEVRGRRLEVWRIPSPESPFSTLARAPHTKRRPVGRPARQDRRRELAHDCMSEAHATVSLIDQGWADRNDVASSGFPAAAEFNSAPPRELYALPVQTDPAHHRTVSS